MDMHICVPQYIDGHFDTTTGNKRDEESYKKIVKAIGVEADRVTFYTDIYEGKPLTLPGLGIILGILQDCMERLCTCFNSYNCLMFICTFFLFCFNIHSEATAAMKAGLKVLIVKREGNIPLPEAAEKQFRTITDFNQV